MFGDIHSDNEEMDFVMPAFGDEIPAYNDSPDQVEADYDRIDAFEDHREEPRQFEPEAQI